VRGWHGRSATGRCPRWVMSDKTHVEHNESAISLIADIPGDMDFRCNGPNNRLMHCTN
jgi:hypothetical protein